MYLPKPRVDKHAARSLHDVKIKNMAALPLNSWPARVIELHVIWYICTSPILPNYVLTNDELVTLIVYIFLKFSGSGSRTSNV